MTDTGAGKRFRFGVFEADEATGELRKKGMRVRLHSQPFQVLFLMLQRPGEVLTREEIAKELWPEGTFVDYEHGVNSAVNRLREALGDKASSPRYVETLARRGYRFVAPVERIVVAGESAPMPAAAEASERTVEVLSEATPPQPTADTGMFSGMLATEADLPASSHTLVKALFLGLQLMYTGFYIGALANLPEVNEVLSTLPFPAVMFVVVVVTAALLIPVRTFLLCAVLFRAPGLRQKYLKVWRFLLPMDVVWALAPFLLLHHINFGLALACTTLLLYAPFAQRSLLLMATSERQ